MGNFRFMVLLAVAALFLLIGSGCTVVREYTPDSKAVKAHPLEYEIARKLLHAFVKNDAKTFISLLPEETRKKFTVETFAKTRKSVLESVGEPVSFTYLTTLKLDALHPQIWKVEFRRHNINKTKEFTSEILFKVVTGMASPKEAVITGFHFL